MIVKYTNKEMELLARLMRAEALGEGNLGMLMVGNVGINRVLADCLTFKDINSIYKMIYQSPGGFSGTNSSLFYGNPTEKEKLLAKRVLRGEYYFPATNNVITNNNSLPNQERELLDYLASTGVFVRSAL